MNIRTATEADFNTILKLINDAFQVERFFKNRDRVDDADLKPGAPFMRAFCA